MNLRACLLALCLLLPCAAPAAAQEPGGWLDRFNRQMFELNEQLSQGVDALRQAWEAWNSSMPAIPEDATISLGYSTKDMPQR